MKEILLCKYGEIVLKGANRRFFEETLCKTLRFRAKHYGNFTITRSQSTLTIEPLDDMADVDGMFIAAQKVFEDSLSFMRDQTPVSGWMNGMPSIKSRFFLTKSAFTAPGSVQKISN